LPPLSQPRIKPPRKHHPSPTGSLAHTRTWHGLRGGSPTRGHGMVYGAPRIGAHRMGAHRGGALLGAHRMVQLGVGQEAPVRRVARRPPPRWRLVDSIGRAALGPRCCAAPSRHWRCAALAVRIPHHEDLRVRARALSLSLSLSLSLARARFESAQRRARHCNAYARGCAGAGG
jgi:hypothetical protein